MHISIETTSGLERRLTISVPSEACEDKITHRLGETANKVKLPGYRPGKVPLREIRRRYGGAVRAEIAGELMQNSFMEAIQQESLAPAGSPKLEVVKMDPGIDFEFTATFEVFPNVELVNLEKVQLKRPEGTITPADVDQMVGRLREQRKQLIDVERGAQEEDRVTLDFEGRIDDEIFEGGSGEDVAFVVGAGQMIEDFDQAVRGLAKGDESTFSAIFPDDYQAEDLRGKSAQFTVTIKSVEESELPELDDEFFKGFGVEEGGEEAFRVDIQSNMQREMDAASSNQVKSQVMEQLNELHSVQLPAAMVENEITGLKQQMMQQFQQYGQNAAMPGVDLPDIDLPDDLFTEQAERRVAVGLIVNEIVSSNDLLADKELVKARVEAMAAGYAEPEQVVNYYYSNPEQLQQIEMAVLEDQVIDHILEKAEVESVIASYDDIINGTAIASPEETTET